PPAAEIVNDVDAVAAAYAAALAAHKAPSRVWWPTAILAVLLSLAAAASAFVLYRTFGPIRVRDASLRTAPPPRRALVTTGKLSPGSPALSRAFSEALPEFLIQLDRLSRARLAGAKGGEIEKGEAALDEARRRVLGPDVRGSLGEGAAARLEQLLV